MYFEDPDGPHVIVNQLQLELDGVAPLTDEERLELWIRQEGEASPEGLRAALYLRDRRTRVERSNRAAEVEAVLARFDRDWSMTPGGIECMWLYHEAMRTYVEGFPLASLLCSHAACERVFAGCLLPYEESLPNGWRRWGFGALLKEVNRRGLIDEPLHADFARVNESRVVSAHFKPPLDPASLTVRAFDLMALSVDLDHDEASDQHAFDDALLALGAATELMRGDQGFWRVSFV